MDANAPITLAAPRYSGPDAQAGTDSGPLVVGPSAQSRVSHDNGENAATDQREAAELVSIEGRLVAEFGPSLGPDAVMRCMADAISRFDGAPVRTYVMLLVERRAAAQLRDMRRATRDVNRPARAPTVAPTSTSPG
jgi:hypothetical protein